MNKIITNSALNINPQDYSLLTDLYQLTMTACYAGEGIANKQASFELFTRRLPDRLGYLIAMGLAQAIEYLEQLSFSPEQIQALQKTGILAVVRVGSFYGGCLGSTRRDGNFCPRAYFEDRGTTVASTTSRNLFT